MKNSKIHYTTYSVDMILINGDLCSRKMRFESSMTDEEKEAKAISYHNNLSKMGDTSKKAYAPVKKIIRFDFMFTSVSY